MDSVDKNYPPSPRCPWPRLQPVTLANEKPGNKGVIVIVSVPTCEAILQTLLFVEVLSCEQCGTVHHNGSRPGADEAGAELSQ